MARFMIDSAVSIHAPARGATLSNRSLRRGRYCFNSRPRTGGDNHRRLFRSPDDVSIHAPARGATFLGVGGALFGTVSIHAPARGATVLPLGMRWSARFNSRPRTGGDSPSHWMSRHLRVSIHAPARGATGSSSYASLRSTFQFTPPHGGRHTALAKANGRSQFQFTPPHGGRLVCLGEFVQCHVFQFTPPHGGRLKSLPCRPRVQCVSIHAPARGATISALVLGYACGFQFTPPHGGRLR